MPCQIHIVRPGGFLPDSDRVHSPLCSPEIVSGALASPPVHTGPPGGSVFTIGERKEDTHDVATSRFNGIGEGRGINAPFDRPSVLVVGGFRLNFNETVMLDSTM